MVSFRITAIFLLFGTVWVLGSDWLLELIVADQQVWLALQSIKGLLFVCLSALVVWYLIRRAEMSCLALEDELRTQNEQLSQILNVSPAVVYSLELQSDYMQYRVQFVSEQIQAMTGFSAEHCCTTPGWWDKQVHPDDAAHVKNQLSNLWIQGSLQVEYRLRHANGRDVWISDRMVLVRDAQGRPRNVVGAWLDQSAHRQVQAHARLIERVFEASQQAIFITDARGRFISVNRAFTQITGYTQDEVVGHTPAILKSGRQDQVFYQAMWQQIQEEGRWEGEIWNKRKNGELYPEWLNVSAIHDEQGEVQQYLGIFTETTGRKAAEERIQKLANYDPLTDLPNRALLADRARMLFGAAGPKEHAVLMQLNLDHFSGINESLGHEAGDAVLRELAMRLSRTLKTDATICRLGADNFLVLLPRTTANEASQIGVRLMAVVAEPLPVAGQVLRLSVSMGVAQFPEDGSDLTQLAQAAESAVHQAKRDGRNTLRFFSRQAQEQVRETLAVARDLHWAVERQQLVLHYQPQIDIHTQRIIGIEALVRWLHPTWGMVPPGRFIPVAETLGLIQSIGTWVLREALRQVAQWRAQGLSVVPVAVNLSAVQFRNPTLRDMLIDALREYGLPAHLLELELTESVAMENSGFTIATIASLKQIGVQLSIDDFGTGYSSLGYLKRFAVDRLKIDQSFVRGLNYDRQDEAIVQAVINLAHSLGLRTLAEGVETAEQLDFLRQNGCDEAQGWLFGHAMDAQALAERLSRQGGITPPAAALPPPSSPA